MNKLIAPFAGVLVIAAAVLLSASAYKVDETEQVIITQFGKPVGDVITESGLAFKLPFVQTVNRIDKRILLWDGPSTDMPTKDKLYITVDTFGRWRIKDPLQYFLRLRDERSAQSRLEDILGSETRNAVAKHELIELIRTTKDRTPAVDPALVQADIGMLLPIEKGRREIEQDIFQPASGKLAEFGIELLDVRFKRINYNESVRQKIYARMISERQQIAERFRSEGAGEAARIIGNKERELKTIDSEAYKKIQTIQGDADAKATEIYARAYNQSPTAADLYAFMKTLETYRDVIDADTTLIMSTDSELYRLLKNGDAKKSSSRP
jgi:modulator of FtsH protease HflC